MLYLCYYKKIIWVDSGRGGALRWVSPFSFALIDSPCHQAATILCFRYIYIIFIFLTFIYIEFLGVKGAGRTISSPSNFFVPLDIAVLCSGLVSLNLSPIDGSGHVFLGILAYDRLIQCSFMEHRGEMIVYRRYASLFVIMYLFFHLFSSLPFRKGDTYCL